MKKIGVFTVLCLCTLMILQNVSASPQTPEPEPEPEPGWYGYAPLLLDSSYWDNTSIKLIPSSVAPGGTYRVKVKRWNKLCIMQIFDSNHNIVDTDTITGKKPTFTFKARTPGTYLPEYTTPFIMGHISLNSL